MDPRTILAIVQASDRVLSLIAKYYSDVKNAKEDIEDLKTEVEACRDVLRKIQELARSSNATKLPLLASPSLATAIKGSSSDIENIQNKLDPRKRNRAMSRVGLRALQWPFTKKEMQEHIARLDRHKTTLTLALSSDQTSLILGLQQDQNRAEQDRQLGKLSVADRAAFDSYHQQHEPECVQNTRVDILRQVQTWNADNNKCIFWLNGMAGTGKSTIARTVARIFADQNRLGASFFFSRGVGDLGHATKFVSTLASQLAGLFPLFKQHISQAIADHDNVIRQGLRIQWKELIFKPLSMLNTPNILTLTLVIDALDECEREEDIKLILQLFLEVKDLATVRLKIFLTSRPETPIRLGFRDMPEISHQDLILHDIPRSIVEHDIRIFLRHELDRIRKNRNLPGDWPGAKTIDLLVEKSDCLFIYIATASRFIQDSNWRPQERLSLILDSDHATGHQPTVELDGMYMQILELSVTRISGEKDKSQSSKRFRHIVGSIVTLFNVLSTTALAGLLDVLIEDVNLTLDSLHSVLNVPKEQRLPIRLLHPSFRDFLVSNERCNDSRFYINQEIVHMELASGCLQLLFHMLKRDICNLQMPGTLIHEVQADEVNNHLSKDVQYACRYWVNHLERVDHKRRVMIGFHDDGQIHTFILKHILHWFEALSLMGKLSEGVVMMNRLEAMLELNENSALKATIYDAKRFILSNRSIIEDAPLQLYGSALVFCPKQSVIKASYSSELPTWITRYPMVEDNWSSLLQVFEGSSSEVADVVFSSNGKLLASSSYDGTIRLWDSATGTLQATLQSMLDHDLISKSRDNFFTRPTVNMAFSGNGKLLAYSCHDKIELWDLAAEILRSILKDHIDEVTAVGFSGDCQLLASASKDETIRLWDAATGTLRNTLEGHTDIVYSVAFSGNSQLLASISKDQTIRLWDPAMGTLRSTLEGHTDFIYSLAFSGDSQLLASASKDQTVRLWDLTSRTLRRTLEGHTDDVIAVAFSDDSHVLTSVSMDQTIRLWDPMSGTLRSTHECQKYGSITAERFWSAFFSSNGQILASIIGSEKRTIQLWDLTTGTLRSTLEGHSSLIIKVVFSGDSQLLASVSFDNTVRLWDSAARSLRSPIEGHEMAIVAVAFSGNGHLLASTSRDRTVRLWDVATGTLQSILKGHTGWVTAVAFSGDGHFLASISRDKTVRLWDAATGTLRSTLEGHEESVTAVAFSGNGHLLASASHDQTVRLWNVATGALRNTLESHTDGVTALAFSGNGHFLASASHDRTVRLWNVSTGALQFTLEGHKELVTAVAFLGDDQLLASSSQDQTIRLWDPATGTLRRILEGHTRMVNTVAFSGNGQLLASASWDDTIQLWDPATGNLVQQIDAEGVNKLSFSLDQTQLETNLGRIQLSNDADNTSHQSSKLGSWMVQRNWLTWNGQKVLWLPSDFRPGCLAIRDNLIVIGHGSGRLIFLGLESGFNQ